MLDEVCALREAEAVSLAPCLEEADLNGVLSEGLLSKLLVFVIIKIVGNSLHL